MEKNTYKKTISVFIFSIVFILILNIVFALANPSAVYCEKMGYEYVIERTEGGQTGICRFSETESCLGWLFFNGKCGEEYSYCSKNGYGLKTVSDIQKCIFGGECAVCVMGDGREIPITELIDVVGGLVSTERICGDDVCDSPEETHEICPEDCPSENIESILDPALAIPVFILLIGVAISLYYFSKKSAEYY